MKKRIKKLSIKRIALLCVSFLLFGFGITAFLNTYSEFVSTIQRTNSGVVGNIVYINDADSDLNYYLSQNYTYSADGKIPTSTNKNIYNESNLVETKVTYHSQDVNNHYRGYISTLASERQDTFIYFKYYPLISSDGENYILIELPDNIYTDRPSGKGFNGWTTKYEGAILSYDKTYYERFAKVPVEIVDGKPRAVDIEFHASWVPANIAYVSGSNANTWTNAFNTFNAVSMQPIETHTTTRRYTQDMIGYYRRVTIAIRSSCNGYYNASGVLQTNCTCNTYGGCTYYQKIENSEIYDPNNTYYYLNNNNMTQVNQNTITYEDIITYVNDFDDNDMMFGFFTRIHLNRGESINGYYNDTGVVQSGTCNTSTGCDYYKLVQNDDSEGLLNLATTYYYLVTRDTNIAVMNGAISAVWSNTATKPFTFTGSNNGTLNNSTWDLSGTGKYVRCYSDVVIENISINSGINPQNDTYPASNNTTRRTFYGNGYNFKIGRGIKKYNTRSSFEYVIGGTNAAMGSSSNPAKYKMIVESGYYSGIGLAHGAYNSSRPTNNYLAMKAVYGNDYDRAIGNDSNLDVYFCASGSFGNNYYYDSNTSSTGIIFDLTVKSGNFGSSHYDNTTGIYVGGRYGGTIYASKRIKVEGGHIYNLIGGPLTASNRTNINDVYMYITGGTVDMITAGAGQTATYGNRIVSVTGGTITYSVFGGSNGYNGSEGDGTLKANPYVYIGGNAVIGDDTLIGNNTKLFGAESGSVFGIGNGKNGSSTIGSNDSSNIVIDGECTIKCNVYGGGNYGAVGVSSSSNSSTTNINIYGGNIVGSVYGGGNNNGSGSTSKSSTVNINMTGGNIGGSLYGGSNVLGTVYGTVNINITGGDITGGVYGGGKGGYASNNAIGTYVRDAVNIVIGDITMEEGPTIGKVYGGSAFGTVNGTTRDSNVSTYGTNVTINNGDIGSVFGGGEGNNTYTPYVRGNVLVTVNGGTIDNVFGGNDAKGTPNGTINVYIEDGEVTNTFGGGNYAAVKTSNVFLDGGSSTNIFGGGNEASITTSNVKLNGGTAINVYGGCNKSGATTTNVELKGSTVGTIFGGSNESGTVTTSNVTTTSGIVTDVYGGNNEGGSTTTTNVNINNGTINGTVYGGGNQASSGTTHVNLNGTSVDRVYGGGNEAGIDNSTNVELKGTNVNVLYGGSNTSGTVPVSYVHAERGSANELLGGNNAGGTTATTNITIDGGDIGNIYGGGNRAVSTTSNIDINGASNKIDNIYGGGNQAAVTTANIDVNNGVEIGNVYGGSNEAGDVTNSYINVNVPTGCTAGVPLDSEDSEDLEESDTQEDSLQVTMNITDVSATQPWMGTTYRTYAKVKITLTNLSTTATINNWSGTLTIPQSEIAHNYSGTAFTKNGDKYSFVGDSTYYDGYNTLHPGESYSFELEIYSNQQTNNFRAEYSINYSDSLGMSGTLTNHEEPAGPGANSGPETNTNSSCDISIDNIYGGNNHGGVTTHSNINVDTGTIGNIYGGGNLAITGDSVVNVENTLVTGSVYGGGNQAGINSSTDVDIINSRVNGDVFGGGNLGTVGTNTDVYISSASVLGSVYAGGNGSTAVVNGNTLLNIDGDTDITRHVFGGGNAAATGIETNNNSTGVVNIVGGHVGGNVYGGANTSVLYGVVNVNIGKNAVNNNSLHVTDIDIDGTVFGGGEANASGSEVYDFNFISVTTGIIINIDGSDHEVFDIDGSIFGSGNASSTSGYSRIYIRNYGSEDDIKENISLQRADIVVLDNSFIELSGATDRTNEYSDVVFSLSRLDELKLVNSSAIFLQNGTNLLKKFNSVALVNGSEVKAEAIIDDDGYVTRNVNNRLYVLEGKNVNIATNQAVTAYGEVLGMTFFGMYDHDRDGNPYLAMYDSNYTQDTEIPSSEIYHFNAGSYVLGLHNTNHDITVDGFYSNFSNKEATPGLEVKYIEPTPEDSTFYMWVVGEPVTSIDITLTASKYSTLGTYEVNLTNFSGANTTFTIVGFNYNGLDSDVSLVEEGTIPRIATNPSDADNKMGLVMKTSNLGWLNVGKTTFLSNNTYYSGSTDYISENSTDVPSLVFYLYHSKNIQTAGDMGTVTISLIASTPIDDLTNDVKRINVNVSMTRAMYSSNEYEGTITSGKSYSMFAPSLVNITNDGSFSAYYSLFAESENTLYKPGYHRVLNSSFNFPANTKITMIDLVGTSGSPEYYYHVVDVSENQRLQSEYAINGEVSYPLSEFVRMGSSTSSNTYDDANMNSIYYNSSMHIAEEEFIFIVDFSGANISNDVLDNSLLFELRDRDNQIITSVIGIQQEGLVYNLYNNKNAVINVNATLSKDDIYIGESVILNVNTEFVQDKVSGNTIADTGYFDDKLGIKITILDSYGNQVNGPTLMGITYELNNVIYSPRFDGSLRINLSERVANVSSNIKINTSGSNLPSGEYTLVVETFGSPDGIYYGLVSSSSDRVDFTVNNTLYGLKLTIDESQLIIDKTTGKNQNNNNLLNANLEYSSGLTNPNIRIALYRRDYSEIYSQIYNIVNIKDYITNNYPSTNVDNIYLVDGTPVANTSYTLTFKEGLTSGTYRLVFALYDGNTYIGDVYKYVVIK